MAAEMVFVAYLVSLVLNIVFVLGAIALCTRGLALATGSALSEGNLGNGNVAAAIVSVSMVAALLMFVWPYFGLAVLSLGTLMIGTGTPGSAIMNLFNAALALVLSLAVFRASFLLAKKVTGRDIAADTRGGDIAAALVASAMAISLTYVLVQGVLGLSLAAQEALLAPQ